MSSEVLKPASFWRPISEAPKDGAPLWAYLNDCSIRLVRWMTAEQCAEAEGGYIEDYEGGWAEVVDESEEWSPKFWAPLEALPLPPNVSTHLARALSEIEPSS